MHRCPTTALHGISAAREKHSVTTKRNATYPSAPGEPLHLAPSCCLPYPDEFVIAATRQQRAVWPERNAGLRRDHDFLLRGDVFTEDVIDTWIWYKTANECEALRQRPHPFEFAMYYDI